MRYGEEIDEYSQNLPRLLIWHCYLKKYLGGNLDLIRIRATGKFSITYYKDGQRRLYNVHFGNDETISPCSCPD